MNIFDFLTQEEIEELPDDDPHTAFTTFVRIAQKRLGERVSSISGNDRSDYEEIQDARHGFMNVVIAAAKKFDIEPFATLTVPRRSDFESGDHTEFKAELDHYMTQLLLDNSSRAKRDSIFISPELKNNLHTYAHHLRETIAKSDDLGEAKRTALLKIVDNFEAELEKKRLSLMAVSILAITLLSAPGGIWSSFDIAAKLVTNILKTVGEAKIADDQSRRLPSAAPPMALSPPRPAISKPAEPKRRTDLDDEIPF